MLAVVSVRTSGAAFVGGQRIHILNERYGWNRSFSDPAGSAWWILFEAHPALEKRVSIVVDDGTWLSGALRGWSRDAEDHGDRDLVIQDPLLIRRPGSDCVLELDIGAVAISTRRIQYLTVEYLEVPAPE